MAKRIDKIEEQFLKTIKENKLIHPLTIEARNDLMERCINRKVIFCEKIS